MYQLHIANKNYSSWSLRPWILMQELSIPFDEKLSPFSDGSSWSEFRKFSPNGLFPCLVDGDISVWDSLAIVEYLAESNQAVWPLSKIARAWARSATAEMHSGFSALRNQCAMNCGLRIQLNEVSASLQKDLIRIDELWREGLDNFGGPFLAGETFTAVDAFYAPVVFRIQTYGLKLSQASANYVDLILSRQSMQDWYAAAINETWREATHELEAKNAGEIVSDFRL